MPTVTVNKSHATIHVGSHADYAISGDDDIVFIGAGSTVSATGLALTIQVAGLGDVVTLGGDGQFAPNGSDDVVLFQTSGELHVLEASRVDTNANNVAATLAGYDTFGIYGFGDAVAANGTHNSLWVGQNGAHAFGSQIDVVNGLTDGALYGMGGSNVAVNGANYTASLNGDDVLTAEGTGVTITGSGADNVVNVSGGEGDAHETVTLSNGGIVNATNSNTGGAAFLDVFGDHITLRGVVHQTQLIGSADLAVLDQTVSGFVYGGNGESGALDILRTPGGFFSSTQIVADSNVRIVSSGLTVTASGHDRVVVVGNAQYNNDTTGGNVFIISTGLGALNESDLQSVAILQSGDVVHLRANSQLFLETKDTTSPYDITATMAADDTLNVQGGVNVRVPVTVGNSSLAFSAADHLALAAHFDGISDLLAHTTDFGAGSVIAMDALGDQLILNISKAQVGAYAAQGVINFA